MIRRSRSTRSTRDGGDATTVALAGAGAIAVVHALAAPSAGCRVTAVASAGGSSARHLAGQLDEQVRHAVRAVPIDDLPHLQRWVEAIRARPAVQKGILMPPSMRENGPDREEKERQFAEEARKMVEMGQSRPSGV